MSSIVIAGDTSGSVTLQAPAVSGSTILTLPATSGTVQTSGAGFTTNGVAYASSTSALTTGSALTFDGTNLGLAFTPSAWGSNWKAMQFIGNGSVVGRVDTLQLNMILNAFQNGTDFKYLSTGFASRYVQNGGAHQWINAPSGTAGDTVTFTTAMTLNASGNLCVGSTSAGDAGTVNVSIGLAGTTAGGLQLWASSAQEHYIQWGDSTSGSGTYAGAISYAHATDSMRFWTGSTERMRLTSTGLGIGTSSPRAKLNLEGGSTTSINATACWQYIGSGAAASYTSSNYMGIGFGYNNAGNSEAPAFIGFTVTDPSASTNGALVFATRSVTTATAPTERMRIDSSGNLLLGKTGLTTTGVGGYISASGQVSGTRDGGASGAFQRDTSDGDVVIFLRGGTGLVGSISITTTATAYNTSSDYRLKNTIVPMTGALAKVAQLKPVTYKWNADGSDGEGFIAHELAEVCPQAVTGEKDAVDADGKPQHQGIDTSFLVATLTSAIQEQQAIIESLKARLDAANL